MPDALRAVSCHDIAGIWVAFFSRCQRYRCGQGKRTKMRGFCDHSNFGGVGAAGRGLARGELKGAAKGAFREVKGGINAAGAAASQATCLSMELSLSRAVILASSISL